MPHIPVLLHEVLSYLQPQPNQDFIDATFGGGGHALPVLQHTAPRGRLLGLDRNPAAILISSKSYEGRLTVVHENFSGLAAVARQHGFDQVSGIMFDLGLSSDELDDPTRGFSFQHDGPLDMRFDPTMGMTAADMLKRFSLEQLASIFITYGEERFANRIAAAIVKTRRQSPILTTTQLYALITTSLPARLRFHSSDTARRIFQALRVAVNDELESLEAALPQAFELLRPAGRLLVISFHSLEDRIAKDFFKGLSHGCICPPEFPMCQCGRRPRARILTKKPVRPKPDERAANPRSKSAKLRAVEKIALL